MEGLRVTKIVKETKFQRVRDKLEAKKRFQETIICKLCETNSSFHVKLCTMGKFWFVFQEIFASIKKSLISVGGRGTRLSFYEDYTL